MTDFHSHVLPGIDDGSRSVEESLRMLEASAGQGIAYMAATPHFYPSKSSLEQFLVCREQAAARLQAAWQTGFPKLLMGAEVYYFDNICQAEGLEALRVEGTSLLLVEMPFQSWSERMVAEIKALHNRPEFTVLLAHVERYFRFQKSAVWDELLEAGILMQCNASFFLHWNSRHKALHMLEEGRIHLLGSDCHNMAERAPRMGEALSVIGEERCRTLEHRCQMLLGLEEKIL